LRENESDVGPRYAAKLRKEERMYTSSYITQLPIYFYRHPHPHYSDSLA
jgi:hypothetical protein